MYRTDCDKLKNAIDKKGYSMQDIASDIGIDRATLYRRIKNNALRISDIQKIAEKLSLTGEEAKNIFLAT